MVTLGTMDIACSSDPDHSPHPATFQQQLTGVSAVRRAMLWLKPGMSSDALHRILKPLPLTPSSVAGTFSGCTIVYRIDTDHRLAVGTVIDPTAKDARHVFHSARLYKGNQCVLSIVADK
jgi:hypothetical protein